MTDYRITRFFGWSNQEVPYHRGHGDHRGGSEVFSMTLRVLCGKDSCRSRLLVSRSRYRSNCTVTCAPAATCVPAGGDCCRATPLPTASNSSPVSCAASTAPRTVLPTNDGTTMPPCSTSSTTVPVDGSFVCSVETSRLLLFTAIPGWLGTLTCSLCCNAAGTTFPSALAVGDAGARSTPAFAGSSESPSTSAVSSGAPGWSGVPSSRSSSFKSLFFPRACASNN